MPASYDFRNDPKNLVQMDYYYTNLIYSILIYTILGQPFLNQMYVLRIVNKNNCIYQKIFMKNK